MTGLAREKRWNAADFALKNEYDLSKKLHKWILGEAEWHEIYDLLEQFPALAGIPDYRRDDWYRRFNLLLDDEGSPYRFISGELAPITSEEEVAAVAQAAGHAQPYDVASDHIQKALSLFARRPEPDRENTVKEAVSAFESALCIATDMNPGDMNATSKAFCAKFGTHKALMKSALNLFGFGGDAEGVRHAATSGESEVGPEEAQLVLVTASAWVNYIVRIATKAA
jgi:hypothetical protein